MSNAFITRRGGSGGLSSKIEVKALSAGMITVIKSNPTKRYDKIATAEDEIIVFENLDEGKWKVLFSRQVTLTMTAKAAGTLTLSSADFQESYEYTVKAGDVIERKIQTGIWEIKISNEEQTTIQTVNVTADINIPVNYFSATITVTYPAKSQCTCTQGNIVFTDTNDGTSEKTVTFTVPNGGAWDVIAIAESGQSSSKKIEDVNDGDAIDNVKLAYEVVIYNGGLLAEYTGGWTSYISVDNNVLGMRFDNTSTTFPTYVNGTSAQKIKLADFSALKITVSSITNNGYVKFFAHTEIVNDLGIYNDILYKEVAALQDLSEGTVYAPIDSLNDVDGYHIGLAIMADPSQTSSVYISKIVGVY